MSFKLTTLNINELDGSQVDWYQLNTSYTVQQINNIKDPAIAVVESLVNAIPSPFARMHMFQYAFEIANSEFPNDDSYFAKKNMYNKMISDVFDILEILFFYNHHKNKNENIFITIWDRKNEIEKLVSATKVSTSDINGKKLLGDTLQLSLNSNQKVFGEMPSFYLLNYNGTVFAGSSPFTMFFSAPRDLNQIINIKNHDGIYYFQNVRPLYERNSIFIEYLFRLFITYQEFQIKFKSIWDYLNNTISLITDTELKTKIKQLMGINQSKDDLKSNYNIIPDFTGNPLKIFDCCLFTGKPQVPSNLNLLVSQKLPKELQNNAPVVLKDYCNEFGKHDSNLHLPKKFAGSFEQRVLPITGYPYPYIIADDFLDDSIIQLDFPINKNKFITGTYEDINDNDKGFLLPLKKKFFDFFDSKDVQTMVTTEKIPAGGIKVSLNIPSSVQPLIFEKTYFSDPKEGSGKIIPAKFDLSFFPFFKVLNDDNFNDNFKILLSYRNLNGNGSYNLHFFLNNGTQIDENTNNKFHFSRIKRFEPKNSKINSTTYHYSLNGSFDYIYIDTPFQASGVLIPNWQEISLGTKEFAFAIDFGTTNTYVSYTDDLKTDDSINYVKIPETFFIDENDTQVVSLHPIYPGDETPVARYEEPEYYQSKTIQYHTKLQRRDFVPSVISIDMIKASFPTRTVISQSAEFSSETISKNTELKEMSIDFYFSKEDFLDNKSQRYYTNLKWSSQYDPNNGTRVYAFIREILLLIRNKILLNGGNPAKTRITWFKPLSLDYYSQNLFSEVWNHSTKAILKNKEYPPVCIAESVAPFYYHKRTNNIFGNEPSIFIDIGGGSTDVVIVNNAKPLIGTSFNFAGDVHYGDMGCPPIVVMP